MTDQTTAPAGGAPAPQSDAPPPGKRNAFTRFLDTVEWLGNLLPHPVTLFAILALGMVLLSGLLGALGVAVEDPRPVGAPGRAENGLIEVVSLMSADGLRRIFTGLVPNFTGFAPLGVVLVAMLGVGVAEKSVSWLLSRKPPRVMWNEPKPPSTVVVKDTALPSLSTTETCVVPFSVLGGEMPSGTGPRSPGSAVPMLSEKSIRLARWRR